MGNVSYGVDICASGISVAGDGYVLREMEDAVISPVHCLLFFYWLGIISLHHQLSNKILNPQTPVTNNPNEINPKLARLFFGRIFEKNNIMSVLTMPI